MRKIVSVTLLALLLAGAFMLPFNVRPVRAQAATTVYINSDGSVSPSDAPISSFDNITYTFTGNMSYPTYNGIIVERSNIVIDGNGYALQGNQSEALYDQSVGLNLTGMSRVTIENGNVQGFCFGIYLGSSSNDAVSGNNVTANLYGIFLQSSSNSVVSWNNATRNGAGIYLYVSSNNNTVSRNNVTADGDGIFLYSSSNNTVSGNNATANSEYGMYLEDSSNNIVNGNNSTANGEYGICLDSSSNDAVSGNNVTANSSYGIYLLGGSSNIVSENNLAANAYGIYLWGSSNNTVSGNGVRANGDEGIVVRGSSNNIISGNDATANSRLGIYLLSSSNNTIYHNSFVGNGAQAAAYSVSGNAWDDGYPSGGNYWSDYNGTDLYSGPYQNVTGSDGIGDTPYVIDANDVDHFPLMGPFSDFSVAAGVDVQVVSNSTVSDFEFNGTAILFNVTGVNGTMGFCNVCIPTSLVNGTLAVFVNGTQVQYSLLPSSNSTISYLYFTYGQSTEEVIILPEFPDSLILAMFMLATLFSIAIHKKKHSLS